MSTKKAAPQTPPSTGKKPAGKSPASKKPAEQKPAGQSPGQAGSQSDASPKKPSQKPPRAAKPSATVKPSAATKAAAARKKNLKASPALKNKHQRKITDLKKELERLNQAQKDLELIKDAEGKLYCQNENCDQPAVTDTFCRYHYLTGWPRIHARKTLLKQGELPRRIQELVDIFGQSALLFLMKDCKSQKTFEAAAIDMQIAGPAAESQPRSKLDDY